MSDAEILRHSALGTEATYRVIADHGEVVEVEVVQAPGLAPGERLNFTAEAVEQLRKRQRDSR